MAGRKEESTYKHYCMEGMPALHARLTHIESKLIYPGTDGSIHERFELACALHSLGIRKRLYCVAAALWRRRPVMRRSDDLARSLQLPVLCIYNFLLIIKKKKEREEV